MALYLLRPRERLPSMSVRGSVCLSVREDISGTTFALFTKFFMHVACVRGSVLIRHVYDRPHRLSPERGFLPLKNALSAGKGDGSAQRGRSMLSMIASLTVQSPAVAVAIFYLLFTATERYVCKQTIFYD